MGFKKKFELDDFEQTAIRIALVAQIQTYENILTNATSLLDKKYWERELERSKSAFEKINGETIEEYRRIIEESKK
ncbi:hypothetical protein [Paenibacillus sp. FSL L8-0333]|uniref:hypothetical protein n=1 Tax=Paenibacillus sp. FSL L8-0333 TaxID=2975331 RepID=UPI0030CD19D7